jgi:sugar lactone lactonase YvrE
MVTGSFLTLSQAAQAAGDPTIFGQPVSVDTAATVSAATGLDLPRGLAFDGAGDLYIASYSASAIVVPQTSGTLFGQSVSANTAAPVNAATGLDGASGAAFDAAGDLFIANDNNGTVTVVPQSSGTLFGQSVTANTATVLTVGGQPNGIAFDAAGDLFIANATNTVTVLPQASGTLFGQSVSANTAATLTAATGLSDASGIAFDAAGDLFIANADSNSVTVVPATTGTLFGQSVSANTATTISAATGLS